MTLADLVNGQEALIVKVKGHGAFRRRILEMGFIKGKRVIVIKNAPLKDPIEYKIMNYQVSLRRKEARLIEVVTLEEALSTTEVGFHGVSEETRLRQVVAGKGEIINIALIGNPNCGKTTLFNCGTGSYEHVGNYGGVTVDVKTATFKHGNYTFHLSDLPGIYSLSAYSPEEMFVREHVNKQMPDIVINVLDASNIERNLYLTTQLISMDVKMVIALNMHDELLKRGDKLDHDRLGRLLGVPVIPTIGSKGKGIEFLFDKIIEVYEDRSPEARQVKINFGEPLETAIQLVEDEIKKHESLNLDFSPRFLAIKLLEGDSEYQKLVNQPLYFNISAEVERQNARVTKQLKDDMETAITDASYGFIAGALRETYREDPIQRRRKTDLIDSVLTNKLFGFPFFFLFMWVMFQATFTLGSYPMEWIDGGVAMLSNWLDGLMHDGSFKDLVINGVVGGVGGVIVFLPNILILFFFISFMEDTGYMARAAFIMDKVMHKIGLHGKSFIPMVMGFGCNVPAIMATRTIEDRNSRLLTMLINPFMSCSARLPVYILFIGAFFPGNPGTMLFILYATGILLAVIVAKLLKRYFFARTDIPFVMELPPYRLPTLKSTTRNMWHKGQQYLIKMGGIIMIASIIIWFLSYYPRTSTNSALFKQGIEQTNLKYSSLIAGQVDSVEVARLTMEKEALINGYKQKKHAEQQAESYIGRLGHAVEPLIAPLGFDWKMGISLLSGIAAKEVVISTMAVIYQTKSQDGDENTMLVQNIKSDTHEDGSLVFTPLVALAFLMFTLIYFPCIAVIAAIKKESGSWKWALFTIGYTSVLAWLVAFGVYRVGGLFV